MKRYFPHITFLSLLLLTIPAVSQESRRPDTKLIHSINSIPGRYIVVLKPQPSGGDLSREHLAASIEVIAGTYTADVDQIYTSALFGFSAAMSPSQAELLSQDSRVLYVEEDARVTATADQSDPTWGLDRIDQRIYPLNNNYQYTATGLGVQAYIIDSGIRITHQDFGGRASYGADFVGDGQNGNDCFGHGTHVAGTVGSSTWGVAKEVRLVALRVLDCDGAGPVSAILSAVNWITANRVLPAVANLSITLSGPSNSLDTAISNSIAAGVTYTVAAGNFGMDSCGFTPGRIPNVLTIGSAVTDGAGNDFRLGYSNHGPCVDLFAPGNGIISTSNADDVSSRNMNGTSMASPHVAGVAALYLQNNPTASPATVNEVIKDGATTGTVINIDGTNSPNKMLYALFVQTPDPTEVATISGRIVGSNGRGMKALKLTLKNAAMETIGNASTDSRGNFKFLSVLSLNNYTVTPSKAKGFRFSPSGRSFFLEGDLVSIDFSAIPD